MSEIQTEFVMELKLHVEMPLVAIGITQYGDRRIARVTGGTFEGPGLKGTVRDGGGDWILNRIDGVTQLDVRLTMETDDGHRIYMTYKGLRHGPKEVMERLAAGQPVDPSELYFRTAPFFETATDGPYAWLTRSIFVSTGDRKPEGPVYRVFRVL
ncbi:MULTISPECIES: DUF3237 domain-containing protein [Thalassobaculum]|uniref:UPF0311 protein SAMN05660686_02636 n=1 Tax=Thalassobaculum litoreum DSM 18839 TaxID=1123362 RepID=A0A8G2BIC9_9PROT|nr:MULTISPECIES: DUF3237 domain-containing protein [Thalassobaculum]SDF87305.1 Protein of unknown function [Thalassobaculum litoreum DSM 18839]